MSQGTTGLMGRALRGSALTAGSFVITQGLRLASNLILTRLLFPEAFGLMALVSVVLVGLQMFSDTGIGPAISRSPRGDDPAFLDTAWSLNVARGMLLWVLACALAWPLSQLWDAPDLTALLPVAALTLVISGFNPTRIDTANRHLVLGRLTALDLVAQIIGIVAMVALAFAMGSVWALVIGAILGSAAKLGLTWAGLPGHRNRLRWERTAGAELLGFGKWIFLSTLCGFLLAQGDKAVLGSVLSLEEMGFYNIGFFLASFPVLLAGAVVSRVMIPLYRDHPPASSPENAARMRRMRLGLSVSVLLLLAAMALGGQPLVRLLYDDRYLAAGAMVTLIALAQMPGVVGMTYDQSALAAGDGRGYFLLLAARAGVQTAALVIGAMQGGLAGALIGQGLAAVAVHPLIVRLARKHRAWDPLHDAIAGALMLGLAATVIALHGPGVLPTIK
jgi:O-antigen/teichoic acid export membrane protein